MSYGNRTQPDSRESGDEASKTLMPALHSASTRMD